MKVTVKENKVEQETKFPCLMISKESERIVLFEEDGRGTLLVDISGIYTLGSSSGWVMQGFKPFNGTIELSNE